MKAMQRFVVVLLVSTASGLLAQEGVPLPKPPLVPRLTPSPVEQFRTLLATNAAGREVWLANRSAPSRAAIEAKLREYNAMSVEERDQKLRASQLSWYLPALMRMPATNRATVLALIPEEDRKLIEMKLSLFTILPPSIQNQVLTNQNLIRMIELEQKNGARLTTESSEGKRLAEQVYPIWTNLLALPPANRAQPLSRLTAADRTNMEMSLSKFSKLSADERQQALAGFKKFAELSSAERETFLKSAKRWQSMSETERELWRKVAGILHRAPAPPPMLPLPHIERPEPATLLSTNN